MQEEYQQRSVIAWLCGIDNNNVIRALGCLPGNLGGRTLLPTVSQSMLAVVPSNVPV